MWALFLTTELVYYKQDKNLLFYILFAAVGKAGLDLLGLSILP